MMNGAGDWEQQMFAGPSRANQNCKWVLYSVCLCCTSELTNGMKLTLPFAHVHFTHCINYIAAFVHVGHVMCMVL